MDFKGLVRDTGKLLGLENFEADEENVCHFVSEEMTITVECIKEWDLILMSAPVCEIPSERKNDVQLFRAIAEANFLYQETWGSTISVNPKTDCVHIFRYDRAYDWTPEDLVYVLGQVARGVFNIRDMVEKYDALAILPGSEHDVPLAGSDFILV